MDHCRAPELQSDREATLTAAMSASDVRTRKALRHPFHVPSLLSSISLTLCEFILLFLYVLAASGFQFAIERCVRLRQLRVDGDERPTRCGCLCAGPEMLSASGWCSSRTRRRLTEGSLRLRLRLHLHLFLFYLHFLADAE